MYVAATNFCYILSLHDALPISNTPAVKGAAATPYVGSGAVGTSKAAASAGVAAVGPEDNVVNQDRKSTRLNSSHANISYAVFCLKKKKRYVAGWHFCRF